MASRVLPIARVRLLPVPHALGVLGVPEIISVLRLGQPGPLQGALPGLAALRFEAIALALGGAAVGKKKLLAVQALTSAAGRFHRFQNQKEPVSEDARKNRKKIHRQEDPAELRRKKSFQRIGRRKASGRRSHS
jgi:hypothetical protein